jgi:hypothetical protein
MSDRYAYLPKSFKSEHPDPAAEALIKKPADKKDGK